MTWGNSAQEDPNEERAHHNFLTVDGKHKGAQKPMIVSTKQQQIAKLAKEKPKLVFTSLNHQLDIEWLYEAYRLTRKDGAVGIDGETAYKRWKGKE